MMNLSATVCVHLRGTVTYLKNLATIIFHALEIDFRQSNTTGTLYGNWAAKARLHTWLKVDLQWKCQMRTAKIWRSMYICRYPISEFCSVLVGQYPHASSYLCCSRLFSASPPCISQVWSRASAAQFPYKVPVVFDWQKSISYTFWFWRSRSSESVGKCSVVEAVVDWTVLVTCMLSLTC